MEAYDLYTIQDKGVVLHLSIFEQDDHIMSLNVC